jgi:hypothetical protein
MALARQRGLTREADFQAAINSVPSDFEMKWGKGLSSQDVRNAPALSAVFSFLEDAAQTIQLAVDALTLLLDFLASIVDLLLLALELAVDVVEGFILALKTTLEAVKQAFEGTSLSLMKHMPLDYKSRRRPSEILYDVGMSFLDKSDPNRPVADAAPSFGFTLVAMYSLPSLEQMAELYNKIASALSFGEGGPTTSSQPSTSSYKSASFAVTGTSGMAPDWSYNASLSDWSILKVPLTLLDEAISSLASNRTFAVKVNSTLNTVRARLARAQQISNTLLSTINSITTLLALGEGSNAFVCYGSGKSDDFARAVINAPNHPSYPKSQLNELDYGNYEPLVQPNQSLGQASMFSGALVLHLQAGASPQSEALIRNIISAVFKETQSGQQINTAETASAAADKALKRAPKPKDFKNLWSSRKDQAPRG